jgi:H+-transporting ATPase
LKQADCGTAVSGATDAARSAAALILTAPGLSVINNAIDEARRIFGRINSYTIYRVALTLNIMFLVTLSTIFFHFTPLTAVMIVILALLDDLPIMAIAYDNTEVATQPIRWRMPRVLGIASVLAFATIVQTMGLLLIGLETLGDPSAQALFHLRTREELQTVMFLQVALGGHLLLYNTRTAKWFFLRPWPSLVLIGALLATEILAVLMAGFGWLVPQLHWTTIGWAVLYMIAWMFVIDGVKHAANKLVDFRDPQAQRSIAIVQAPLLSQAPSPVEPSAA